MRSQAFFGSPDDCARAFYDAFAQADIEALMSVWADDDDICCAHPAAAPLYGYAAVRSAWEAILRGSAKMRIEMREESWHRTIGMVTLHAIQWIYVGDEPQPRGPVFVTNVFQREPQGWRLIVHHASPLQTGLAPGAGQVVLH